ncbi:MAG TPA: type III-A CRISPR-associated RAMP protein Csm3 [Deltaproteobacteria bacterium]|nr:type III-A CRISPR-associated RAMP protein Csm3 [Deltaproteobacteria bacterium]
MAKTLQLSKKIFIKGKIVVKTGIHIGGSSLGLQIGGADKVVVRNPVTNLPYIPGSSLKGKLRSLLEKSLGLIEPERHQKGENEWEWAGKLCTDPTQDVVQLFGSPADISADSGMENLAPTRLTVRDAPLLNEEKLAAAENTDMYCTEIKTEVSIDRLTSAANPRNFERVPAGAEFGLDMVVDIYNIDEEGENNRAEAFIDLMRQGLTLLEDDYLGGQGTRGYGQVKFVIDSVTERTADDYRSGNEGGPSSFQEKFSAFMNR